MSKGQYNLPQGERGVDNLTYNPQADAGSDNAAFDDSGMQPVGARGADNQPSFRDAMQEDNEATQSEASGKIPRSEYMRCSGSRAPLIAPQGKWTI